MALPVVVMFRRSAHMSKTLPTPAKVVGVICLLAGLWNGCLGLLILLFGDPSRISVFGPPQMKFYGPLAVAILGWYFVAVSIAFLRCCEAGRRGLLIGFAVTMALVFAVMASYILLVPRLITVIGAVLGTAFWGAILYLAVRYLRRDAIIKAFKDEPVEQANGLRE